MSLVYRPARADELERATELVVASLNDLAQRHGFGAFASVRPPAFARFSLNDDGDGLWVAEEAGEMRGFAFSWACGDLWVLAQLFVATGQQGRGIGRELLGRTLGHARKTKAAVKALVTPAYNPISQGLYLAHGFFPRCPIYHFEMARDTLQRGLPATRLRVERIGPAATHGDTLAEIDRRALGVSRAKHHRFLAGEAATTGFVFHEEGRAAGYAYLAEGHIGPLAVARAEDMRAVLAAALRLAAESGAPKVSAFLPGPCEAGLRLAVEGGMRMTMPLMLMSTSGFGAWAQYLPRSAGFL